MQVLTPATFQSTLDRYERAIVMYMAPWCGHCKTVQSLLFYFMNEDIINGFFQAKPHFIEAAKGAKANHGFAAVDCAANAGKKLTFAWEKGDWVFDFVFLGILVGIRLIFSNWWVLGLVHTCSVWYSGMGIVAALPVLKY